MTEFFVNLPCISYRIVNSLLNALDGEYFCFREISINLNKLLELLLLPVYFLIPLILYCCSRLQTKLTETSLIPLPALYGLLYCSLMNALKGQWLRLRQISIMKTFYLHCYCLCILFMCFVLFYLLVYPLFYTKVVVIFLFIRWLCKQANYFCFWSYCLSF